MVSLIIVALAWCSLLVMLGIETGIYIREFRWYVRFGAAYVLVGDAVMLNLILSVTNFYTGLSQLARWLGEKAEELGVEIYPGFAASEILYDDEKVIGIATNDMGIAKDGSRRDNFQCGVELKGRITLLGEGCRGSLSEKIMKKYNLREKVQGQHQTYALGIKEVWEIDSSKHEPGHVLHTLGWPLDNKTYGGSFLYHMKDRQCCSSPLLLSLPLFLAFVGNRSTSSSSAIAIVILSTAALFTPPPAPPIFIDPPPPPRDPEASSLR